MAVANHARPVSDVFADIVNQLATLARKEIQLARAEMSEKVGFLITGLGVAIAGALLVIPALAILFLSAVAALMSTGLTAALSALIVGGVAFIVGLILLGIGAVWLKAARPVPTRTIEQLQRDARLAKELMGMDSDETERAA